MRGHGYDALVGVAGCDKTPAGHDDGHAAPQRAVGVPLRRLDPARPLAGPGRHGGRRVRGVGQHSAGKLSLDDLCDLEQHGLPRRRRLRRPVHRQHHGLRLRGDRPGPAALGGAAGALREPRRLCGRLGRGGGAADREEHPPARHLHPQGVRERRGGGGGDRRLDQRRPAPAGHGPRVRHRVHPARRGRDLPPHALSRRPEAGRPLRRQGHGRGRRRAGAAEDPAGGRLHPRRLHDRHRQDHGREPRRREMARRSGRDPAGLQPALARPAGWSACGARSPRTAPSSRWPA